MHDTIMETRRYEIAVALGNDVKGLMPLSFEPAPMDIVCGRGCANATRAGNRFFGAAVEAHLQEYRNARNRTDKSLVVTAVMKQMQDAGSRFLKMDKTADRWRVMTRQEAHNKTGHAIRDMIRITDLPNEAESWPGLVSPKAASRLSPRAASRLSRSHSETTQKKPPPKPLSPPQRSKSLADMIARDAVQPNEMFDDARSSFVTSASLLSAMFLDAGELQDVGDSPKQHTTNSIQARLPVGSSLRNTFDETPIPLEVPCNTPSDEMIQSIFGDVAALPPHQKQQQDRTMDPSCSPDTKRGGVG